MTSTLGYLLNGRYTFRAGNGNRSGLLRYMLVNVSLLVLNGTALRILVEHYHVGVPERDVAVGGGQTPRSAFWRIGSSPTDSA